MNMIIDITSPPHIKNGLSFSIPFQNIYQKTAPKISFTAATSFSYSNILIKLEKSKLRLIFTSNVKVIKQIYLGYYE